MDTSNERWMGVDWGNDSHAACVLDGAGKQIKSFAVEHSEDGLDEMVRTFKQCGSIRGVAVETNHGLVVHKLLQAGITVYPINPKLSDQWRKARSVSESKNDRTDALILADGLRLMHEHLRPLELDDELTRELAMLCRAECGFIQTRTALVLQLQAALKEYHPRALAWFDDWTKPTPWDFVERFSTPDELSQASRQKLVGFLKTHQLGLHPKWKAKLDAHDKETTWPSDPPTIAAKSFEAKGLVKLLKALQPILKKYRKQIEELFARHPDAPIFDSLPGVGPKLGPRLLAHFGTRRDRYESARALQELSGTVPVTRESGNHREVRMRRACQKRFRNTMHFTAFCSLERSAWARAFYDQAKDRGDSNALALRKLGAKWINIIYRMWQEGSDYDEGKYLTSLIRHGSPLIEHIKCGKHGG